MNIAVSPRVQATKEIKKYFNDLGINSTIRSAMTNKKGIYVDIIHDEIPQRELKKMISFIDDIQKKYKIKTVNFKERLPF